MIKALCMGAQLTQATTESFIRSAHSFRFPWLPAALRSIPFVIFCGSPGEKRKQFPGTYCHKKRLLFFRLEGRFAFFRIAAL